MWGDFINQVMSDYLADETNKLDHFTEVGRTIHLTNSDVMRLARQIENNLNKIYEYAGRIEQSDHPLKNNILETLKDNQILYVVDVVDIVRGVLEEATYG